MYQLTVYNVTIVDSYGLYHMKIKMADPIILPRCNTCNNTNIKLSGFAEGLNGVKYIWYECNNCKFVWYEPR